MMQIDDEKWLEEFLRLAKVKVINGVPFINVHDLGGLVVAIMSSIENHSESPDMDDVPLDVLRGAAMVTAIFGRVCSEICIEDAIKGAEIPDDIGDLSEEG